MKINTKMTDREIVEELKSINAIIDSNSPRYLKKFSKKLNSKEYKHNDVLSVEEYKINGNKVIICFHNITSHAIDRMWERMGLTIKDFFVDEFVKKAGCTFHFEKYEYGRYDSTHITSAGKCFFIVEKHNNWIEFTTTINWEKLHPNQMKLHIDSKRDAHKFADKMYEKNADWIKGMGYKNMNDAVIAMCA